MIETKSQANQDEFVHLLMPKRHGTFFDIGSHDPVAINNTYALETCMAWQGYLFDLDASWGPKVKTYRKSPMVVANMCTFDWNTFLQEQNIPSVIDYLSFDIDGDSLVALQRFPFDRVRFQVVTLEHDRYRVGLHVAESMRSLMTSHGYKIMCKDVTHGGLPFEDWYVHEDVNLPEALKDFEFNMEDSNTIVKRLKDRIVDCASEGLTK
jgi:hypothetical protein